MAASTGSGTTVVLTTGGTVSCVRSLTMPEWTMEAVDASCLEDTGFMKKVAGRLTDGGEVQITCVFNLDDDIYAPSSTQDTLTITLPTAGVDSGDLTGTGFVTSCSLPTPEINGLLEQTFTFTFDGSTGPAWDPGAIV